jgi:putative phage-type endonuclease
MKFPDCKLIDCEQRSDEWFNARKGYLTASQYGDWLTKTGKVADKAKLTAASKVLAEMSGYPDPQPYENDDIKRGVEFESIARDEFQIATGYTVDEIGFCKSIHGYFGCSPDGLILDRGEGLEIKIPRASKLIQYLKAGELPDEYKPQVHGSLAVTGARAWHFFAWHPGFPYLHVVVKPDAYTDAMREGLKSYSNYFESLVSQMAELQMSQSDSANLTCDQNLSAGLTC